MTENFDAVVIGGGVLGCFAARELRRYDMSVALLERESDVCTGITRANTAVVYGGYDSQPGTLKTRLCVAANRDFARLCAELDVPYKNCGGLMTCFGERGESVIRERIRRGAANGVTGLRLITHDRVMELEPNITPRVRSALYAPMVGTVNPWELGIAAAENAACNGAELFMGSAVRHISRGGGGYIIETDRNTFSARAVINCAGLHTDEISELVAEPYFRIVPTRGDYAVLDDHAGNHVSHVIFHEPEEKGKGATLTPTVDGNILLGPSETDAAAAEGFGTSTEGQEFVRRVSRELFPQIPLELTIRTFGALRPNPFWAEPDGTGGVTVSSKSIKDFIIGSPSGAAGFFNVAGVKTPGLTCSAKIGGHVAAMAAEYLGMTRENGDFDPVRRGIPRFSNITDAMRADMASSDPGYARLLCRCRRVTEGEVIEAIRRGAVTLDGVKRRTGAGMGRCQGSFCSQRITELLARELGIPAGEVEKDGCGSFMFSEGSDDRI